MVSTSSRLRIQEILSRLAKGDVVNLQERIYLNKYASRDHNVALWLRKASNLQQNKSSSNPIDKLIEDLNLCESDPNSIYNPDHDELGDWFSGAPSWLRRS